MALTLNAEQKSIYDIFSGKTHYYIPPYQRPYSWQIQHCRELFEDLKREFYNEEKEGYFLGNIVLAWSAEEKNRFEVIDGQQRLTTLLLLLKVILSFDSENSDIKNAIWLIDNRTKEIIGERLQFSDYVEKGSLYQEVLDLDLSSELCEEEIDEKNLFMQNICYFYKEIKALNEYEKIEKFVDFLLYDVSLLPIETGDSTSGKAREKALKIFETINNRGLNLSNADIFKARLYEEALNELEEDKFIELWNQFERNVNETKYSIDDVFYIYMHIIRGQEGIRSRELNIRDFFMEESYSPFITFRYDEILYAVLKVVHLINFFEDVMINPMKYGELTKWFQIIGEYNNREIILFHEPLLLLAIPIIKLYFLDLNNYEEIILNFKIMIKYLLKRSIKSEYLYSLISKMVHNENIKYYNDINVFTMSYDENERMKFLLNFYLNENQKAIYPYYFKEIYSNDIKNRYMIVIEFYIPDDFSVKDTLKVLEMSNIKENIHLVKKIRKRFQNKIIDLIDIFDNELLLSKQHKDINKRIGKFLKNED